MPNPTTYISVKIMPEDAITTDRLAVIEKQISQLLSDQGVKAYLHGHQLVKAS